MAETTMANITQDDRPNLDNRPIGFGYLANREHLGLLKQGVAIWNELRNLLLPANAKGLGCSVTCRMLSQSIYSSPN